MAAERLLYSEPYAAINDLNIYFMFAVHLESLKSDIGTGEIEASQKGNNSTEFSTPVVGRTKLKSTNM